MKIVQQEATLLHITPNAAQLIERAGRVCYKSEDKITADSAEKFVTMLKDRGHHAVLEMSDATFHFVTDRGVTHELVRHRLASFCQESTRYCNYSQGKFDSEITVIEPPFKSENGRAFWLDAMQFAEQSYICMIRSGSSPQIARSVLPNSLKAEIIVKANLREWMHIIELRTSPAAHPQIRELIGMAQERLAMEIPCLFQ